LETVLESLASLCNHVAINHLMVARILRR